MAKGKKDDVTYQSYPMVNDSITMGAGTVDSLDPIETQMTYSFGDLGQLDLFSEEDLREKYPALRDAWEHYQNIKKMCESREKETDEN